MMLVNTQLWIFLNEFQADLSLANTPHSMEKEEPSRGILSLTQAKMLLELLEVRLLPCENWAG